MSSSILKSFGVNAEMRLRRTKIKHHDTLDTTFAPGWLVPVYVRDVIPSDVWNMKEVSIQVKQALASAKPTFGDVYLSVYYFYVPYRILWKNFTKVFGGDQPSEWDNPVETVLPLTNYMAGASASDLTTKSSSGNGYDAVVNTSVQSGQNNPPTVISKKYNLADYLGFALTQFNQTGNTKIDINWLWFAAYEKVWSEHFRDENVMNTDPDVAKCYEYSGSGALDVRFALHYACKLKDVYTSCLPSPPKRNTGYSQSW